MFERDHKFKTEKQDKKGAALRFLCAFLAFALVFGSISAVVIFRHNDISLKNIFVKDNETETSEETDTGNVEIPKEIGGSENFLLYCTDNNTEAFRFMAVVTADMDEKVFRVYPINANEDSAYITELKKGGYKALVSAVESRENVKIGKYIASNDNTFALAINYMGGLEYTVDNRIEHRKDDYTLILTQGSQTIKGETLLKYFRYCSEMGTDGLRTQGLLICAMLDSYVNEDNLENGMKIYQKLLTKINSDSDISYIDASKGIETLRAFNRSDDRKPASVIINAD